MRVSLCSRRTAVLGGHSWRVTATDGAVEQALGAADRPRSGPTGQRDGGALRVPALRRAPGARSSSVVFDRPCGLSNGMMGGVRWPRSVCLAAASACAACDGITKVSSSVLAVDRRPIRGATVAVTNAPRPVNCLTDGAGACELTFGHGGWYNLYAVEVSGGGFRAAQALVWAGRRMRCQAVLAATSSGQSSRVSCE